MRVFDMKPCREIGSLKSAIKDAILDGVIPNEHDAAFGIQVLVLRPKQTCLIRSNTTERKRADLIHALSGVEGLFVNTTAAPVSMGLQVPWRI